MLSLKEGDTVTGPPLSGIMDPLPRATLLVPLGQSSDPQFSFWPGPKPVSSQGLLLVSVLSGPENRPLHSSFPSHLPENVLRRTVIEAS